MLNDIKSIPDKDSDKELIAEVNKEFSAVSLQGKELSKEIEKIEGKILSLKMVLIAYNGGLVAIVVGSLNTIQYRTIGVSLLALALFLEILVFAIKSLIALHEATTVNMITQKVKILEVHFKDLTETKSADYEAKTMSKKLKEILRASKTIISGMPTLPKFNSISDEVRSVDEKNIFHKKIVFDIIFYLLLIGGSFFIFVDIINSL